MLMSCSFCVSVFFCSDVKISDGVEKWCILCVCVSVFGT